MATKDQQINQLMDMGFGNNRVVRALQATEFKVKLFEMHRLDVRRKVLPVAHSHRELFSVFIK